MRKLDYVNAANDEYKFGDTSAVLTYTAYDDDTKVAMTSKTLQFKVKDDTSYVASAPGQLNSDGTVSLKTADIKDLTPGTYFVELWISAGDTTAIYPSKGFVSFTVNESTQTVTNKYSFLTLTELINNFNKAVADVKGGKISFRVDKAANLHAMIGKASFDAEKLAENYGALLDELLRIKPASSKGIYLKKVTLSTTNGPGIPVDSHVQKNYAE